MKIPVTKVFPFLLSFQNENNTGSVKVKAAWDGLGLAQVNTRVSLPGGHTSRRTRLEPAGQWLSVWGPSYRVLCLRSLCPWGSFKCWMLLLVGALSRWSVWSLLFGG